MAVLALCLLLASSAAALSSSAHSQTNLFPRSHIQRGSIAQDAADAEAGAWLSDLESKLDPREVDQCESYLVQTMPKEDRSYISRHDLRVNSILALTARYAHPWSRAVPWSLFLSDVLPYANLDEPRDAWRAVFTRTLTPLVANATSLTDAALRLNRDMWALWGIVFKANQTPMILSPSQVIAAGYASCTGLSIFLVNACRAVGIPARVTGTPSWRKASSSHSLPTHTSHTPSTQHDTHTTVSAGHTASHSQGSRLLRGVDTTIQTMVAVDSERATVDSAAPDPIANGGNHDWVEIWDNNMWSFIGAAEYDPQGVNRTWFFPHPVKGQVPGSRLHAVYAASWGSACGDTLFPLIWDKHARVPGCDVTQAYLDTPVPQ